MRVVSQSRNYSFDFDRTIFWTQCNIIYAKIGVESIAIGKYESDKRAAEVFEDMHKAYSPVGLIYDKLSEEQVKKFVGSKNVRMTAINIDNIDCTISTYDSIVYYMPEV